MTSQVRLVGSNPGAAWRRSGRPVCAASWWTVEWSPVGSGTALVLWPGGSEVHLLTASPALASWLWESVTRWFPEFAPACDLPTSVVPCSPVGALEGTSLSVTAPGVSLTIEAGGVPHLVDVPAFPLGDQEAHLRNVLWLGDRATLTHPYAGASLEETEVQAFVALAESWAW